MRTAYLKKQGQSPKDYVISKFKNYDYVFLGEYHRIKQDVDFVSSLIPDLYKNGVRNLAYESEHSCQAVVDGALSAKEWNEQLLYHNLSTGFGIYWGYTEYLNIFKKAWEFNQTLEPDQPKFRIVLVSANWDPCREDDPPFGSDVNHPDDVFAEIFEKEVIEKDEKALIFCGKHHAFTRYKQPIYNFEKGELEGLFDGRFGNIIHKKYPEKTFNIFLHSPWTSNKGWEEQSVRPVNGVIDSLMATFENSPMGFDVRNVIMGKLKADDAYYAFGYEDFKLEDFCDGYIFLAPYKEMKFVSPEPNFYDDYNLNRLKITEKCRGASDEKLQMLTKELAVEWITENPENHFGDLVK
ncbi:hypothetical protein LJB78_00345 [Bacteroidales bacterium OttesenSCG-928-J16]|nr:hypothetical protein [Bacteroidales bacterium OttesenSCG-928-J16]